jgi:hypothetical protein
MKIYLQIYLRRLFLAIRILLGNLHEQNCIQDHDVQYCHRFCMFGGYLDAGVGIHIELLYFDSIVLSCGLKHDVFIVKTFGCGANGEDHEGGV